MSSVINLVLSRNGETHATPTSYGALDRLTVPKLSEREASSDLVGFRQQL